MKIAVIGTKGLPASQGGIERYCQEVYPAIANQGHTIDLYARQHYTHQNLGRYKHDQVNVINLPSIPHGGADALLNACFATLICLFGRYDVIHFHALGPSFFCFLPRILSRSKVVVTCHGLDWQRAKWDRFSKRFLLWGERMSVRFAHELIVVSEPLQQYFWARYHRKTNFIPTAPATYAESDPGFRYVRALGLSVQRYIVFLGRLVPEKRPELLLEAFQKLKAPGYKLVYVGGTSDTDFYAHTLKDQAACDNRVIFTGELSGEKLAEIVRGAGIFVLPSDLEGFPLVILEAMREGIPVVASNIAPHQALVGTNRGRLFQAGDVEDCLRCLRDTIEQKHASEIMADRAQRYVAINYQWNRITQENLHVYHPGKRIGLRNKIFRSLSK